MALKKLLREIEAARDGEGRAYDLLGWLKWAHWGQPVPPELRPAILFASDVLGEPVSPWALLIELVRQWTDEEPDDGEEA